MPSLPGISAGASIVLEIVVLAVLAAACWDRLQTKEPRYRVYPVVGRFVEATRRLCVILGLPAHSDAPFSSDDLTLIRQRALSGSNLTSFGTKRDLRNGDFGPAIDVAVFPSRPSEPLTVDVGGGSGGKPLEIPILNFGALGFGPVNENVIRAFGDAAAEIGCLQNTGEDGLTRFHVESGARLVWQLGTGYGSCHDADGRFSRSEFQTRLQGSHVAMIEVKLSQGAKPGVGGLLPAAKNSPRVARILGVQPRVDVVSPSQHSAFSNTGELLRFLKELSTLSDGMPVGIKLCVGSESSFRPMAEQMARDGIVPDFITIDGAEGGTGAGPSVLQDHAGLPVRSAVTQVDRVLRELGIRNRTRIFAAGGIRTGFDVFELLALGADGCFFTRAPMVAIGCVEARECHTGRCPAGIATQSWWRRSAVDPTTQGKQLVAYYHTVMMDLGELMAASGVVGLASINLDSLLGASL